MGTEARRRAKVAEVTSEETREKSREGGGKRVREEEGRLKETREATAQLYGRKMEESEMGTGWGV